MTNSEGYVYLKIVTFRKLDEGNKAVITSVSIFRVLKTRKKMNCLLQVFNKVIDISVGS